jgi:protein O-mannosyl-transferase
MGRRSKKQRSPEGNKARQQEETASQAVDSLMPISPSEPSRAPSLRVNMAVCGFLLLAVVAVFGQSAWFDFLNYDDGAYVSQNRTIQQGIGWKAVAWSFTSFDGANWHPVTWLSHTLDCQLFGLRAGWHHAVNVALHAANSILLFILLVRMTGATWRSAMVAALFALHPLHVESVAWVAERKDVLSTLFAMLTMLAYVRYAARPSATRYVLVMVLFALGLMSKPMLVTLPFVLLLLDYWPLGRWRACAAGQSQRAPPLPANPWRGPLRSTHARLRPAGRTAFRLVIEKVPLLVLAAASSVVTCIAQQSKGAMAMLSHEPSFPERLLNALVSYVAYLGKTVWPSQLIVFYPYPAQRPLWQPALAAVFLIVATGIVIWCWRRLPYLAVGWFWYLGTLLPVIGLVQVGAQSMADRYTYIPLIGIFILGVWSIGDLTAGWRYQRTALAVSAAGVILVCMGLSTQQTADWADNQSLFTYVLSVTPDNAAAHSSMADDLLRQNRNEEAEVHCRELARIEPKARAYAHLMWGQTLVNRNRQSEAVAHFREAIRLDPNMAIAHNNLAMALMQVGKPQEVIEHLNEAARLAPDNPEALNNLAWVLTRCLDRKLRDSAKAVELGEQAVKLSDRQEPEYLATLAAAYAEVGRSSEALQVADEAISLAARQKKATPADALRVQMLIRRAGSLRGMTSPAD